MSVVTRNKKPAKRNKMVTIKVRLTALDKARIQMLASQYAEGNISRWVRHTALCFKTKRKII